MAADIKKFTMAEDTWAKQHRDLFVFHFPFMSMFLCTFTISSSKLV